MTANKKTCKEPLLEIVVNCNFDVSTIILKKAINKHIKLRHRIVRKRYFLTKKQKK